MGERSGTGGKAVAWALRQAVGWGVVAVVIFALVAHRAQLLPRPASAPPADPTAQHAEAMVNTLVYPVDARGHVRLDGDVNGATVHFVLDTGATLVTLTARDAEAAGINPAGLNFSMAMNTANGRTRAAPITLREVRLGQLSIEDVQGVVVPNLSVSLLGMSFLSRLDRWEMRGGALTISY
ncbi:MAG TPA: TIGR02281 family clan AA aspartic protease [Stellaceae bacterium]|jgi:aspartyl protease family protein|nr:TIGR02281 family clan AA aspartic protease [Stellaceae bacterium]